MSPLRRPDSRFALIVLACTASSPPLVAGCSGQEPGHTGAEARRLVREVYLPYARAEVDARLLGGCFTGPASACAGPPGRYLAPSLIPVLLRRAAGGRAGGMDPVLCAQNIPLAVEVGRPSVSGSTARMTVVTVWDARRSGRVPVRVRVDLRTLRISGITCADAAAPAGR